MAGFNLFDFNTIPGTSVQKIGTGASMQVYQTPIQTLAQPMQSKPSTMQLFKDEEEANQKMLNAGLNQEQANELHKKRRNELLGKISQEDGQALIKMREAGLRADEAAKLVKEKRDASPDTRPLYKKAGEGVTNFLSGNLDTVLKYGGNVLDLATFGQAGFGEDVKGMTEQNKELFKDSGAFTAGSYLPDVALSVAPLGKAVQSMSALKGGALVGAGFGAAQPLLDKGTDATLGEVATGGVVGGTLGAVAGPVVGKVVEKGAKYGTALLKGGAEGIGKSISRDVSSLITKDVDKKSKALYDGIAKISTPKGKTVPQIKAELDRGYNGAKEFVARNPNLEVDVIKNFEQDIPNTLKQTYQNYDKLAKANKQDLSAEMEQEVERAIGKSLKGLSTQSGKELSSFTDSLRKKFGGLVDENGKRYPLTMEQVQNELKILNADLKKSFISGKSSLETSILRDVVENVNKLADKKLTAAYGGERGAYGQLRSFADQTRNVWLSEMKRQGVKTEDELFDVLNNAGLAYDIARTLAGSPSAGFWATVKGAKLLADYLKNPTRNYNNLIKGIQKSIKPKAPVITKPKPIGVTLKKGVGEQKGRTQPVGFGKETIKKGEPILRKTSSGKYTLKPAGVTLKKTITNP